MPRAERGGTSSDPPSLHVGTAPRPRCSLASSSFAAAALAPRAFDQPQRRSRAASALSPNGNDACFECHGQVPMDGNIDVDGQKVPGHHRRQRRAEEHLRRPRTSSQLAPRQARLHQLPHRLQCRHAPGERHPGLAADRQGRGLRRLPRREALMYEGSFHGALVLTRTPTRRRCAPTATTRTTSCRRTPPSSARADGHVHPLPRGAKDDLPRQLSRQGVPAGRPKTGRLHRLPRGHRILPTSDPASSISTENVVATCAKCHPGANANFADFRCT